MSWEALIILAVGAAFFASAVYAFYWSASRGQLRDFDSQSRSIFDDEEPEGVHQDYFPGKSPQDFNNNQASNH